MYCSFICCISDRFRCLSGVMYCPCMCFIGGRCLSGVCCMCVLRTECVIVASAVLIAVEGFVSDCLELLQSASHPLS